MGDKSTGEGRSADRGGELDLWAGDSMAVIVDGEPTYRRVDFLADEGYLIGRPILKRYPEPVIYEGERVYRDIEGNVYIFDVGGGY